LIRPSQATVYIGTNLRLLLGTFHPTWTPEEGEPGKVFVGATCDEDAGWTRIEDGDVIGAPRMANSGGEWGNPLVGLRRKPEMCRVRYQL